MKCIIGIFKRLLLVLWMCIGGIFVGLSFFLTPITYIITGNVKLMEAAIDFFDYAIYKIIGED